MPPQRSLAPPSGAAEAGHARDRLPGRHDCGLFNSLLARLLGSAVLGTMNGPPKPDEADHPAPPELESAGQLTSPG